MKRIALDVAGGIVGAANIVSLDVSTGADWSGDIVHFLEFTLLQDLDRGVALEKRSRLRHAVLEGLAAAGDDVFPHVRIHNRVSAPAGG